LPFKTFVSSEILTASDVNSQIMNQQIMVFADATARDAALTSPSEGMFAFLKDTDTLTYYDGTSWEDF
jgi:hypothetical protein